MRSRRAPGHRAGQIGWPRNRPDPETSFATLDSISLQERDFHRPSPVARDLRRQAGVAIFVHGFNHNVPKPPYRLVQLTVGSRTDGVPMLFSWLSAGSSFAYLADEDTVALSRDDLAPGLAGLVRDAAVEPVKVVAHSMGGLLLMEARRLQGRGDVMKRLSVTMAAPDIHRPRPVPRPDRSDRADAPDDDDLDVAG